MDDSANVVTGSNFRARKHKQNEIGDREISCLSPFLPAFETSATGCLSYAVCSASIFVIFQVPMYLVSKTVFISYRRTNVPWALAISHNLTQHGYDVFFDFNGIASGDFEQVILGNIKAREHFLVLLTPWALERCGEPTDWLRREIETALDTKRNIVPVMLEGFDFATPGISNQLTGTLASLGKYNALRIPAEYFDEGMQRMRNKWLNVKLARVLQPATTAAKSARKTSKQQPLLHHR
jgi:hypothetical protein